MTQEPSRIVTIDRSEYENFIRDNRRLMERYKLLLEKLDRLTKVNGDLEQRLQSVEQSLRNTQDQLRVAEMRMKAPNELTKVNEEIENREVEQLTPTSVQLTGSEITKLAQTLQDVRNQVDMLKVRNLALETTIKNYEKKWARILQAKESLNQARADMVRVIEEKDVLLTDIDASVPKAEKRRSTRK